MKLADLSSKTRFPFSSTSATVVVKELRTENYDKVLWRIAVVGLPKSAVYLRRSLIPALCSPIRDSQGKSKSGLRANTKISSSSLDIIPARILERLT